VLFRVLRAALRTLRSAGWPALALGFLYLAALAIVLPSPGLLLFIGVAAQNVVTFALVRHLAAHRGLGAKGDGPPPVTPTEQALGAGRGPGPLAEADRSARHALRNAAYLARPAIRLALVQLVGALGIVMMLLAVGGERVLPDEHPSQAQIVRLMIGLVPVAALISAFIAVAPQRIAIEGDRRVIFAVLASIRIARSSYGTLFAVSLLEPLALLAEVAAGNSVPVRVVAVVVHPVLRLVVVAALNEVYAAAPALVVPEPGATSS
jgi:hypothetical protein